MSKAIGIHGMGRIGRNLFRLLVQRGEVNRILVASDLMPKENLIYLLTYDTILGNFSQPIHATNLGFEIAGHEIIYLQSNGKDVPKWSDYGVTLVVEATGLFTQQAEAEQHLISGAGQVLLTTFGKDFPSFVWGVNHQAVAKHSKIVSPGDCSINCVAPIIKLVNQSLGVKSVHVNVIQAYTTRQELIDGSYKGMRRGRAAAQSIIPFEINIRSVLENIFPHLMGSIETMSTRVPISCGALAQLSFRLNKDVAADLINTAFARASEDELRGVTAITHDPIVSSDILGNSHSGVIDGQLTRVIRGDQLYLFVWFDNEWGYSNRLVDWIAYLQA